METMEMLELGTWRWAPRARESFADTELQNKTIATQTRELSSASRHGLGEHPQVRGCLPDVEMGIHIDHPETAALDSSRRRSPPGLRAALERGAQLGNHQKPPPENHRAWRGW